MKVLFYITIKMLLFQKTKCHSIFIYLLIIKFIYNVCIIYYDLFPKLYHFAQAFYINLKYCLILLL